MNSNKRSNNSLQAAVNKRLNLVIILALILVALLCVATSGTAEYVHKTVNTQWSGLAAVVSAVVVAATAFMTALISLAKMINHMNNHLIHHSINSLEEDFTRKEDGDRHDKQLNTLSQTMTTISQKLASIEAKLDMIEKHLLKK